MKNLLLQSNAFLESTDGKLKSIDNSN